MTRSALAELALEFGPIEPLGYRVEELNPHDTRAYPANGWLLIDRSAEIDGHNGSLMIADYGCLSPTRYAAELEAYRRIARDAPWYADHPADRMDLLKRMGKRA